MALCLHPKRNTLDLVAAVATAFLRWQVSVTVPPEAVKHFSKDMKIARRRILSARSSLWRLGSWSKVLC